MEGPGPKVVAHTTMYLDRNEYKTLAVLPAAELHKTRWIVIESDTRVAIDKFHGELEGLVLAEVDLGEQGRQLALPPIPAVAEVTEDERFTGGALAATRAHVLAGFLQEFTF
jgi:CYTH domain-containing protein